MECEKWGLRAAAQLGRVTMSSARRVARLRPSRAESDHRALTSTNRSRYLFGASRKLTNGFVNRPMTALLTHAHCPHRLVPGAGPASGNGPVDEPAGDAGARHDLQLAADENAGT